MNIHPNTRVARRLAWAAALLLSLGLGAHAQPAAPASAPAVAIPPAAAASTPGAPPVPVPLRPFREIVRDAKEFKGFFTLHQKDERVWLEIRPEQLDKPFFFSFNVPHSVGERGLYSGMMGGSYQAMFHRIGNQVQLIAKNTDFRATPGTPQAQVVSQGFSDSLLASAPVLSLPRPDNKAFVVDASALLFGDIPGYSTAVEYAFRMGYGLDRANTSFGKLHVDEQLTGVEVNAHYSVPRISAPPMVFNPLITMPTPPRTTPDPRSFFVGFYYNFMPLPEQPMAPRLADDRVGHFSSANMDFSDDTVRKPQRYFVNRWRLEKKDPAAELSEPKQPITYWLDKNIPLKYRQAVTDGVLEWNKAFERIGYKNAIVVKQQQDSDTFDTMDSRHASIRWFVGADAAFAIGPSVVDERSGEILDADIGMSEAIARGARRQVVDEVPAAAAAPLALAPSQRMRMCTLPHEAVAEMDFAMDLLEARGELDLDSPQAEALTQAFVKLIVSHEVGHTLGLRHNFRSSTIYTPKQLRDKAFTQANGLTGSVMDYIPFNLAVKGEAQGEYVMSTLGPYDYWAIEYAYKTIEPAKEAEELARIAGRSNEPQLAYGTDEDSVNYLVADPEVNTFDLGSDPLGYVQRRMQMSRELWDRLQTRQLKPGDSYETLRRSFDAGFSQFARMLPLMTKYVGGTVFVRDHAGTPRATFTPVQAKSQRLALKLVSDSLFTAKSFVFTPELLSRLGGDYQQGYVRNDVSISLRLQSLQAQALDQLMSDLVAVRLQNTAEKLSRRQQALTLYELYNTVQSAVWSELASGADIPTARRNLQREHLKRLTAALVRPAVFGAPADVRSLQRQQATQLLARVSTALQHPMSREAHAHLLETQATLNEALKAPLLRTGV